MSVIVIGVELWLLRSSTVIGLATGFILVTVHGGIALSLALQIGPAAKDLLRGIRGEAPRYFTPDRLAHVDALRRTPSFRRHMIALVPFMVATPFMPLLAYITAEALRLHFARIVEEQLAREDAEGAPLFLSNEPEPWYREKEPPSNVVEAWKSVAAGSASRILVHQG